MGVAKVLLHSAKESHHLEQASSMDSISGWFSRKKLQFELYTSLIMVEPTEKIAICIHPALFSYIKFACVSLLFYLGCLTAKVLIDSS